MAAKSIKAILTLKDKNFSTNMKKASTGVNNFSRKLKHSSNQAKKFKKNTVSSFRSVAKSAIGLAGAYLGFRAISNGLSESVEAAKAQISVEKKLETVLKQRTKATDAQIKSILILTAAQQGLGIIGDEIQIAGAQQLATFVSNTDSVKKLIPAMNNLLAQQKGVNATQQDAVNIGNLMGKVLQGQTGALTRVGITFTKAQERVLKYGTESEKAAMLAKVITDNVGQMNKALAETDEGKIQNMTNAWGDYKEEIGKKILPLQAKFAGWFAKKIPGIQAFTLKMIDKIVLGVEKFKKIGTKAIKVFIKYVSPLGILLNKNKDNLKKLGSIALRVKDWMIDAFQKIKEKIKENQPTIDGVKGVLSDLGDKALQLKDWLIDAFESAKPSLNWIKNEGLPLVVDGIAGVIDKATDMYNYINDNWSTFEPIILGIAGAIGTYKIAMLTATAVTKGATIATNAMAIAQGVLNAVMSMSPIGWISIAIGGLIALGVALYKNWDTITAKAGELWEGLKSAFATVGDFFKGMFEGVKTGFKSFINFIIRGINNFTGTLSWIPEKLSKVPGFKWAANFVIPKIPEFALGTSYFKGGLARINERGGEIVNLPNGSKVIPADKSEKIINENNSKIQVNVIIQGNVIGNEEYAKYVGNVVARKIQLQLANR